MSTLDRVRRRLQAHPLALDAVLACVVLAAMVCGSFVDPHGPDGVTWSLRSPDRLSLVLIVISAGALVLRRRAPMTVLVVTGACSVVESVTGDPRVPVVMASVVALYTVASRTDRATTLRAGLVTTTALTGAAMLGGPLPWYAQDNIAILAWTGVGATAGDAVRSRRAVVRAMRERAEKAERTREEEARRRVAEERLRIARDLHDVVAHHIALVNVQAGVAAHVMDKRPDQAKQALAHVREASRSALDELRATVGLLRQTGDPEAPTEPAPGLDRLEELVGTFRTAGLLVELVRADDGTVLPAAVDLAAYRVIQEALTNVHKHAGPRAKAEVSVARAGRDLEITVLDDGGSGTEGGTGSVLPGGAESAENLGGGHGLLGMRERVTALGGALTTGPRLDGGWRVHAVLPLGPSRGGDSGGDSGGGCGGRRTQDTTAAPAKPPSPAKPPPFEEAPDPADAGA